MSAVEPYGIEQHSHRFAAWAASRAASVKGCRLSASQGRDMLEACGLTACLATPQQLPMASEVDRWHRERRSLVVKRAGVDGLAVTHGIAAKVINVYLKSRFVCAGNHTHPNVAALHPPIDRLLLTQLRKSDFGGETARWRAANNTGWSMLSSGQYEELISSIRACMAGRPLWMVEEHWEGYQ
jgi:hypothetical protein